jgi:Flp pilus assembly protein TadD
VFLVHLAFAYQQLERHREAADAFGRAVATGEPADANLLGQYVEALLLAKDEAKALTEVRAARGRFPDDPELAAVEANVLRSRGDVDAAVAAIEKLRLKAPDDVNVLVAVADFYQKAKRYSEMPERTLRHAREVEPKNLRILFQLGAVLERLKRSDAAEAVFREALGVEPDSAPVSTISAT